MRLGHRMRIVTLELDTDPPEPRDIEVPLRRLASSPERLVAARWQKLLELIQVLRADGPYPEAWGHILGHELYLSPGNPANRVTVRVRADWQDFAPLRDGMPEMHYRLKIQQRGAKLSRDARAKTPEEVEQIIREAFGWSR
jgi:hypothetical protein